jgi:serine/threonine-protein kinase
MTNIYIEQRSDQTSANAAKLCFRDNNNHIKKLGLNAFDSYEDKQLLLNAIRTWAPTISRDTRVIESLQPPSDYSYTELWLQALSAPPKRERFKPLIRDAVLKNERYRVLGSLGAGGQGFAYLVEDCSNQQEVVLKEFILPVYVDISVRKSALKQFENEARILSQLQHPQIVRLLDFFVEDHRAYLVLEHIDGSSMRTIVEGNGPLSIENTRALANQMCDILSYLHSQIPPVVHRDFTPDNLILNTNGTLKLIDFNVAQNTESTTTGTVVGKPAYLPPEQFRGTPTTQSDIYAMGATLYFLLTGCDPTPISVSHPTQINSEISASWDNIIARATDLDLNNRYANIAALKDDLATII